MYSDETAIAASISLGNSSVEETESLSEALNFKLELELKQDVSDEQDSEQLAEIDTEESEKPKSAAVSHKNDLSQATGTVYRAIRTTPHSEMSDEVFIKKVFFLGPKLFTEIGLEKVRMLRNFLNSNKYLVVLAKEIKDNLPKKNKNSTSMRDFKVLTRCKLVKVVYNYIADIIKSLDFTLLDSVEIEKEQRKKTENHINVLKRVRSYLESEAFQELMREDEPPKSDWEQEATEVLSPGAAFHFEMLSFMQQFPNDSTKALKSVKLDPDALQEREQKVVEELTQCFEKFGPLIKEHLTPHAPRGSIKCPKDWRWMLRFGVMKRCHSLFFRLIGMDLMRILNGKILSCCGDAEHSDQCLSLLCSELIRPEPNDTHFHNPCVLLAKARVKSGRGRPKKDSYAMQSKGSPYKKVKTSVSSTSPYH